MKSIPFSVSRPYFSGCIGIALLSAIVTMPLMAAESPSVPVGAGYAKPVSTYKPKAGETLDKVIQNTIGASPLGIDVLRKAFIDLNPKAFLVGKITKIRPGVTLKVPDLQSLMLAVPEAKIKEPAVLQSESGFPSGATDERRRWVRYP